MERNQHEEQRRHSPKEKKQKKDKKEKKEKKNREDHDRSPDKRGKSRQRSRQKQPQSKQTSNIQLWKNEPKQQERQEERTHVSCRRCKENTFSLATRTCSSCGYPKQSRPAYFPVTKQVQVLDLVREGKMVHNSYAPVMIQVVVNDRMGKRQRIKCCPSDTILQFKKLISAQIGTRAQKIRLQKSNIIFKDHITIQDYEIKDGMGLQMYYD